MNANTAAYICLAAALLIFGGCSRETSAPAPLPVAQIPTTIKSAFTKANPDAQSSVNEYVTALQSKELPKAFSQLRDLSARRDLTPDQRAVAARAMATTFQQLRLAAEAGDPQAAAMVHSYLVTR